MAMWLYDDFTEIQGFQFLRREVKRLEKEYLDLRIQLRDAETDFRSNPGNKYFESKIKYLTKRLKDLDRKPPRFSAEYPLEISLYGPPHG